MKTINIFTTTLFEHLSKGQINTSIKKKELNILIISQYFFPENFRVNDLVFSLKKKGHNIKVLTGKPNYSKTHFFDGYGWNIPDLKKFSSKKSDKSLNIKHSFFKVPFYDEMITDMHKYYLKNY